MCEHDFRGVGVILLFCVGGDSAVVRVGGSEQIAH